MINEITLGYGETFRQNPPGLAATHELPAIPARKPLAQNPRISSVSASTPRCSLRSGATLAVALLTHLPFPFPRTLLIPVEATTTWREPAPSTIGKRMLSLPNRRETVEWSGTGKSTLHELK